MNVEALYREHEAQLRRRVRSRFRTQPPELVEDACHHAWLQAWRNPRPVNFSWLYVVACRKVRRTIRVEARRYSFASAPDEGYGMEGVFAARELLRAVACLHPMQKAALSDAMAGFSYEESAARRGRTCTWVNRHRAEGREAVREALAA